MAWNDTKEGADLNDAWQRLQKLYNVWLPQHKQSLQNLANRPISG